MVEQMRPCVMLRCVTHRDQSTIRFFHGGRDQEPTDLLFLTRRLPERKQAKCFQTENGERSGPANKRTHPASPGIWFSQSSGARRYENDICPCAFTTLCSKLSKQWNACQLSCHVCCCLSYSLILSNHGEVDLRLCCSGLQFLYAINF